MNTLTKSYPKRDQSASTLDDQAVRDCFSFLKTLLQKLGGAEPAVAVGNRVIEHLLREVQRRKVE